MAYFAKLDVDNNVIAVLAVDNSKIINSNGNEDENIGIEFLKNITGWPLWKKTSYNTKGNKYYNLDNTEGDQSKAYRGNFAKIGSKYDENNNIFVNKKPYESWIFNITTASWEAPIAIPEDTFTNGIKDAYSWNEVSKSWDKM